MIGTVTRGGGSKNSQIYAELIYGWSLMPKRETIAKGREGRRHRAAAHGSARGIVAIAEECVQTLNRSIKAQ